MVRYALFFAFLSLPLTAKADIPQIFVENGTPISKASPLARTVALMRFKKGGFCSSSFLSSRTLLTAGHCAENHRAEDFTVMAVSADGKWEEQAASGLVNHPSYQHYKNSHGDILLNDVAIIQLARPFSFSVRTVSLTAPTKPLTSGQSSAITDVGYGYNRTGGGGGMVLRYGSMAARLSPIDQFNGAPGLEHSKTSADQNVCPGDSGGPVLLGGTGSREQVAVHSLADGCTTDSSVAFSTLVWPYRNWILPQVR
jgi:secreted trypsin-like serine protease